MAIVQDTQATEFLKNSRELLFKNEAQNNLILGLAGNISRLKVPMKVAPIFLRFEKQGQTLAVAIQTPPSNLLLSEGTTESLSEFAHYLKTMGTQFSGVVGPGEAAAEFAKLWQDLTGRTFFLGMGQKIYKLEKVSMPRIHGDLRAANRDDKDLLGEWFYNFAQESLPTNEQKPLADWMLHAERSIINGNSYLFLIDGRPVSTASANRPTENGISINGVYTPKSLRRKGYASQTVALLSQRMLDEGKKFCVLYTDLTNPTSNKIYQKIGYLEISKSNLYTFEPLFEPLLDT